MPAPPFQVPAPLADWLNGLEARVAGLEEPASPKPVYACLEANLPAASAFINCVVRVTDLNILAASDGADWIRQDTGAAI